MQYRDGHHPTWLLHSHIEQHKRCWYPTVNPPDTALARSSYFFLVGFGVQLKRHGIGQKEKKKKEKKKEKRKIENINILIQR